MKSIENPLELMVFNRLNVCMFLSVKYCQSIVGGMFWETQTWQLSGAQKTKPVASQRVSFVNMGRKFKLNSLRLVPCSKAHQLNLPFDVRGKRRGFLKN